MTKTADLVTEAINAEGNVDPKIVKVMIKDAVKAQFDKAAEDAESTKRQSAQHTSKSGAGNSKNSGGAQQKGDASRTKKK